jgi:4-hydroxy-3-methylbut-2-enyl diphosphate reductase
VRKQADDRGLKVFDATCPLVTKVHMEVTRASKRGTECVLIGHAGHPEVEGTMGQYHNEEGGIYLVENIDDVAQLNVKDADNLYYCSQTTLSVDDTADVIDALRARFPNIDGPRKDDICYATQNRQDAVRELASDCDLVLVVGAQNSSNSNRLRELAEKIGATAKLIATADCIQREWVESARNIGVTAGASAPEVLVQSVIERLKSWGAISATERSGREENVEFAVPKELRVKQVS